MDTPDAVLPLVVGLRPIRRQHHAGRVCDLPAAHSCDTQTPWADTGKQMLFKTGYLTNLNEVNAKSLSVHVQVTRDENFKMHMNSCITLYVSSIPNNYNNN